MYPSPSAQTQNSSHASTRSHSRCAANPTATDKPQSTNKGQCISKDQRINKGHRHSRGQLGFTLIEILIALFIFAIMSVMTAIGIRRMIRTQQHVTIATHALQRLQLAMTLFQRDISAINPHRIKQDQTSAGALIESQADGVRFITANDVNPSMYAARGILRQVAYQVQNGVWVRSTWPVADPLRDTPEVTQALLPNVESVEIKYISNNGRELSSWPPNNENDSRNILNLLENRNLLHLDSQQQAPAGIEIEIKSKTYGVIRRLFAINEEYLAPARSVEGL